MRLRCLLVAVVMLGCALHPSAQSSKSGLAEPLAAAHSSGAGSTAVTFQAEVVPLLKQRCSPCHFEGGSMYAKLPFDKESTVRELGTRLFTRLKQEDDRRVITRFLQSDPSAPASR